MSNSPIPGDEPIAPKGAYSVDFDKFDDPNFNPFETKKAMSNSPTNIQEVKSGDTKQEVKTEETKPEVSNEIIEDLEPPKRPPPKLGANRAKVIKKKPVAKKPVVKKVLFSYNSF